MNFNNILSLKIFLFNGHFSFSEIYSDPLSITISFIKKYIRNVLPKKFD